jgi:hypothetical protein
MAAFLLRSMALIATSMCLAVVCNSYSVQAFSVGQHNRQLLSIHHRQDSLSRLASSPSDVDSSAAYTSTRASSSLDALKAALIRLCDARSSLDTADPAEIRQAIRALENEAERAGVGQSSSLNNYLSGDWELLYAAEDVTRSSPFFWAFRQAFPEQSDAIYRITDSIPEPLKSVGPAYQIIDYNTDTLTGRLVSKVQVATLGGFATTTMTTRATIVGIQGVDGLKLQIETTKPENSTILTRLLGPLGDVVNENSPAFPSGAALERVRPGSSQVVLQTTFCDEGMRISRNGNRPEDVSVWRRRNFASFDYL